MAFVYLDTDNLLQDEPLTSPEVLALYENPLEAFNGAANAPRIAQKVILPTGLSPTITFSGFAGWQGVIIHGATYAVSSTGGVEASLSIRLGDGSGLAASEGILDRDGGNEGAVSFILFVDFATGDVTASYWGAYAGVSSVTAATPTGDITQIQLSGDSITGMAIANGGEAAS